MTFDGICSTSTENPFERHWYFHKYIMCKGNRGHDQVTSETVYQIWVSEQENRSKHLMSPGD